MWEKSIIAKAHEDVWYFRVTLSNGRVLVCGGMGETDVSGFIHLKPVDSGLGGVCFEFPMSDHQSTIWERGIDVNQRYIVSVEDGIS